MGIDGFNKFMREAFPGSFTRLPKGGLLSGAALGGGGHERSGGGCDRLYIDCNDLLHQAARRAHDEVALFEELFALLDTVLFTCRPARSVVIALDGPGPFAKVLEQRKRRANTGRKASAERGRVGRGGGVRGVRGGRGGRGNGRGRGGGDPVLSGSDLKQALTPGTALMHRLRKSLVFWAESKLASAIDSRQRGHGGGHAQPAHDFGELHFYVTGSDVPGEGEMKILAELYHQARPGARTHAPPCLIARSVCCGCGALCSC